MGGQDISGQWIVVDRGQGVLSVGRRLYRGQSLRNLTSGRYRDHLSAAVRRATSTAAVVDQKLRLNGRQMQVHVEPIAGPSRLIHGSTCYIGDASHRPSIQDRPSVGAWEWDLQGSRTRWSRSLYPVYGLTEPENPTTWSFEAPQWFDLLEPGAYPRMMELLARLRAEKPGESGLMFASFRLAGDGRQLRLSGRGDPGPQVGHRLFRGLTMRTDGYLTPEEDQDNLRNFADVFLALSSQPMAVIHFDDGRMNLRNRAWREAGLDVPDQDDEFLSLIHPHDREEVAAFLLQAPMQDRDGLPTLKSRVRINGSWTVIGLCAMAVRFSASHGAGVVDQVMVRLET